MRSTEACAGQDCFPIDNSRVQISKAECLEGGSMLPCHPERARRTQCTTMAALGSTWWVSDLQLPFLLVSPDDRARTWRVEAERSECCVLYCDRVTTPLVLVRACHELSSLTVHHFRQIPSQPLRMGTCPLVDTPCLLFEPTGETCLETSTSRVPH